LWLTAAAAHAGTRRAAGDPFQADIAALAAARQMVRDTLIEAPGLSSLYRDLSAAHLLCRPAASLPSVEAAVEAVIRRLLGDNAALSPLASQLMAAVEAGAPAPGPAPGGYRPFRPVPLWPDLRAVEFSAPSEVETRDTEGTPEDGEGRTRRARRRRSDQAERTDSFILHKFEAILSWAEFMNLNRRVEDDDLDNARKAADDQEEIGLGQLSKAPATRLKLHLDLAPEDVDREALAGSFTYPEWDARTGVYLPAHVRVLASDVTVPADAAAPPREAAAARRIKAVRRQFEA